VVDAGGYLTLANERARAIFRLSVVDLARPFQDLELSYRPLELRSKIQQVYVERRPFQVDEVEWPMPSGEVAHLEVQVVPLIDDQQALLGASISFVDVTRSRRYKQELEQANQGLEDAYAELQSTNEELQATNRRGRTVNCRVTCSLLLDNDKNLRDPAGTVLAGPLVQEEGILHAELDLDAARARRRLFDPVGHYNRPDVFRLVVDDRPNPPVISLAPRASEP
jgi:PAS fold